MCVSGEVLEMINRVAKQEREGGEEKKQHKCHLMAAREAKSLVRFNLPDASQISVGRSRGSRNNRGIRSTHKKSLPGSGERFGGGIISRSTVSSRFSLLAGETERWFLNTQTPRGY